MNMSKVLSPAINRLALWLSKDHKIAREKVLDKWYELTFEQIKPDVSLKDFTVHSLLGKGGSGKVYLVKKDDLYYAMKVIPSAYVAEKITNVLNERRLLEQLHDDPFVTQLHYAFCDEKAFYLVMKFYQGGDLFSFVEFASSKDVKSMMSELVVILQRLHLKKIIYRDLKPENILVDTHGHVVLSDFGLSKKVRTSTNTFCGTREYMAPEIIRGENYGFEVDWWSLGVLFYELKTGQDPSIFMKERKHEYLSSFDKDEKDLLWKLLNVDVNERLTFADSIRKDPYFKHVNWKAVEQRRNIPPTVPCVDSEADVQNFALEFTTQQISLPNDKIIFTPRLKYLSKIWTYSAPPHGAPYSR
jgi:serine/threonine protein kinase